MNIDKKLDTISILDEVIKSITTHQESQLKIIDGLLNAKNKVEKLVGEINKEYDELIGKNTSWVSKLFSSQQSKTLSSLDKIDALIDFHTEESFKNSYLGYYWNSWGDFVDSYAAARKKYEKMKAEYVENVTKWAASHEKLQELKSNTNSLTKILKKTATCKQKLEKEILDDLLSNTSSEFVYGEHFTPLYGEGGFDDYNYPNVQLTPGTGNNCFFYSIIAYCENVLNISLPDLPPGTIAEKAAALREKFVSIVKHAQNNPDSEFYQYLDNLKFFYPEIGSVDNIISSMSGSAMAEEYVMKIICAYYNIDVAYADLNSRDKNVTHLFPQDGDINYLRNMLKGLNPVIPDMEYAKINIAHDRRGNHYSWIDDSETRFFDDNIHLSDDSSRLKL